MHTAAEQLQFELAARLRDEIRDLKKELRQMTGGEQIGLDRSYGIRTIVDYG